VTDDRVTVAVADDDPDIRAVLADLIASQPHLRLVGTVYDHPSAIRLTVALQPALLLLDVRMPGGSGPETARAVRNGAPHTSVLAISGDADPSAVLEMMAAGARGYVAQGAAREEILAAVQDAAAGRRVISPELALACLRALDQSLHGTRQVFDSLPEAALVADAQGVVCRANPAAERIFGYTSGDLIGREVGELLPALAGGAAFAQWVGGDTADTGLVTTARRRDGVELPVEVRTGTVAGGEGAYLTLLVSPTSEDDHRSALAHSLRTLEATGRDQHSLLTMLLRAQDQERSRIAAGIHDDTLQVITAATLRIQQLRQRLHDPAQLAVVDKLDEVIALAADRLRELVFELRPPALEQVGLAAAMRRHLERMRGSSDRPALEIDDRLTAEPGQEARLLIYRIAQEGLANAVKHARANRVGVTLSEVTGGYHVQVVDDGVGYYPLQTESKPGHLGLTLMRERAEAAGGWCRIESAPGQGTTVEFWVPGQPAEGAVRAEGDEGP
jgi:PAS domain S-box-containing protein